MMADKDWYQNTIWNDSISEAFFARLDKARSQRDQYLVIQASILSSSFPGACLELIDVYFKTRKTEFHDSQALLIKAEAYRSMRCVADAVRAYKEVLAREAEFPNVKTRTYLEFPFFVACNRIREEYQFVLQVLSQGHKDVAFPADEFLWQATNALIAEDSGRLTESAYHAKKAIEVAKIRKSGFRYHQDIGLVGKEHQAVFKQLLRIAR